MKGSRYYKKLFLFIPFLTFIAGLALGQSGNESKNYKNNIELNFGFVHSRFIDNGYTDSNLKFRGTNGKLGLGYQRKTSRYILDFSFIASGGKVKSKSGNLPSDFYTVHVFADYLRKIKDQRLLGKENEFFAGIHASSINYYLQSESVIDNIDFFSLHGIYFNLCSRLKLSEKQSLQINYFLPMIVYENRVLWNSGASKYTYDDKANLLRSLTTNGHTYFFNVNKNLQLKADYILRIGRRTDFKISYMFLYANNFVQSPVRLYSNELLIGLKYNF